MPDKVVADAGEAEARQPDQDGERHQADDGPPAPDDRSRDDDA
jgi:hypothetical protein